MALDRSHFFHWRQQSSSGAPASCCCCYFLGLRWPLRYAPKARRPSSRAECPSRELVPGPPGQASPILWLPRPCKGRQSNTRSAPAALKDRVGIQGTLPLQWVDFRPGSAQWAANPAPSLAKSHPRPFLPSTVQSCLAGSWLPSHARLDQSRISRPLQNLHPLRSFPRANRYFSPTQAGIWLIYGEAV